MARGVVARDEVEDPWNLWVFRIDGEVGIDGETTQRRTSLEGGFSASRVTPDWRVRFWGDIQNDHFSIDLSEGDVHRHANRLEHGYPGRVRPPRSLVGRARHEHQPQPDLQPAVPDRSGARAGIQHLPLRGGRPAAASSSTTRSAPPTATTPRPRSTAKPRRPAGNRRWTLRFSQRQPWGNASVNLSGSHFLHDFSQRLIRLGGDLEFRVFRGLSLEVSGNISSVNDPDLPGRRGSDRRGGPAAAAGAGNRVRLRRGGRLRVPVRVHLQQRGEQPVPAAAVLRGDRPADQRSAFRSPAASGAGLKAGVPFPTGFAARRRPPRRWRGSCRRSTCW